MQMDFRIVAVVVSVLASGCAAQSHQVAAALGQRSIVVARTVFSGAPHRIGFFYWLNPDCSAETPPTLLIKQQPAHGWVTIAKAESYPNFSRGNQRYECNKQKVDGEMLSYTSWPGYVGPDALLLQEVGPTGASSLITYTITVLPMQVPGAQPAPEAAPAPSPAGQ